MESNRSTTLAFPKSIAPIAPMETEQTQEQLETRRRIPKFQFRVLVVGRANAGKTSILQRVCATTESPIIYRGEEVIELKPSENRGEHRIDDELVFSNHRGYVFHDSMGIESGSKEEVETLKGFIRRKCEEKRLRNKLHAIWYCIPMDSNRPSLDLKFYANICPDPNVPVIALFTKYDQFLYNVEMDVTDEPENYPDGDLSQKLSAEVKKRFRDHYLGPLGSDAKYVRLEKMHLEDSRCDSLVEETAAALNEDTVVLMLLAVQRSNIELSVKTALSRVDHIDWSEVEVEQVIRECLIPFPYIWAMRLLIKILIWIFFLKILIMYLFLDDLKHHHLIIASILILKHAMFLRPLNESQPALFKAEQNYQGENINSKIQPYLKVFSQNSVKQFADFIMATDMEINREDH
ncbi:hypothetical protein EI94DRAFT_1753446 [Lactarius quietus]|nr:hypothetical protein EI94DRAFT_1753446 [Lactarius quietus]